MSIAKVIGWKFNHQPGMRTRDDVITEFPGGIPTQAEQDAWTAEYNAYIASNQSKDDEALLELSKDRMAKLLFEINFDQENRLRTLQGQAAVTRAQYRNALFSVWRTL